MARKRSVNKTEDKSPKVYQRDKINKNLTIIERSDLTKKQTEFLKIALDKKTQIMFIRGPAGTSKTFLSVLAALELLNVRKVSELLYIRSIVESASRTLGSLPGEIDDKFKPFIMPLMDKLEELLPAGDIRYLQNDNRIRAIPINFLRGSNLNAQVIVADEAQNFDRKELTTLITRMGKFSKMYICGDPMQSDINGKSGFNTFYNIFNDKESQDNGVYCFEFFKEDIVRSGIVQYIIEKLEDNVRKESMFPHYK